MTAQTHFPAEEGRTIDMPPSLRAAARQRADDRGIETGTLVSDVRIPLRTTDDTRRVRILRYAAGHHASHVLAFVDDDVVHALYFVLPPGPRVMVELCCGPKDVRFERTDVHGVALFRNVPSGAIRFMYALVAVTADLAVRTAVATDWMWLP